MRIGFLLGALYLAGFVCTPGVLSARPVSAPAELQTVHVLFVFDTNDPDLADGLKKDKENMTFLIRTSIPSARIGGGAPIVLEGNNASPRRILEQIKKMPVRPNDALFVFYGGHGGQTADRKLFLAFQQGKQKLMRDELLQVMEARKAGLTVLVTDCCSDLIKKNKKSFDLGSKAVMQVKLSPVMRSLFFLSRGKVDVTAATDDKAYGDDDNGGFFTAVFVKLLHPDPENVKKLVSQFDEDKDRLLSWDEFFKALKGETEKRFSTWRESLPRGERNQFPSKPQSPTAYKLARLPLHRHGKTGAQRRKALRSQGTRVE